MSNTNHKRIQIAILGLNFGRLIIKELCNRPGSDYFELVALCDQDLARCQEAVSGIVSAKEVAIYSNLDELLCDPNVEVVGLFTGPKGRANLMRTIIRAGRHVITTKPMESDPDALLAVLEEAHSLGLQIHCNSPSLEPAPDLTIIQEWVETYGLGRPIGARGEVWVNYREQVDGTWYDDPESCPAAPIYRLGIYLINDLVNLWGPVSEVQLLQSRIFTGRPTADNAQIGLLFANHALGSIYASFCIEDGNKYHNGLILNYENGTIYRNTGPAWISPADRDCCLSLVKARNSKAEVVATQKVPSRSGDYHWQQFFQSIRQPDHKASSFKPEIMTEGIRILKIIREISLSHKLSYQSK